MAKSWLLNKQYTTNAGLLLDLATVCDSAGGSIIAYSDGTTQHLGAPPDADAINYSGAWIAWEAPGGHQWAAQRSSNTYYRVTMSKGGFGDTGTGPQVPGAADSKIICGSGTDASPGYGNALPNPGGIVQMMADSDGGWYVRGYPNGGGDVNLAWQQDKVTPFVTGDADPYVYYIEPDFNIYSMVGLCYLAFGEAGEQWIQVATVRRYVNGSAFTAGLNPLSGKMSPMTWEWGKHGVALKGYSVHHQLNSVIDLSTPLKGTQTTTDDRIYFSKSNGISTHSPWDGTTTPAVFIG